MADIDVGADAVDRGSTVGSGYTRISMENPANASGLVKHLALFVASAMGGVSVGIFYKTNGTTFSTRSYIDIGNVPIGYSEYVVSLAVEVGDYIGIYWTSGTLEYDTAGVGIWYKSGDAIPCVNAAFTSLTRRTMSLFGWYTLPPVIETHFFLTDYDTVRIPGGFTISCSTDVACHLWLRRTKELPQVHKIPRYRRGVWFQDDKRFCFVAYDDLEQNEPGETTDHTFTWTGLVFCEWRYFYLWGTSYDIPMISTSPIIHLRYPPGEPPFETDERAKGDAFALSACQEWNAGSQTFTPDHDFTVLKLSLKLSQYGVDRRGPYIVKITEVGGSCWLEKIITAQAGYSTNLPAPGVKEWVHFAGIKPMLEVGKAYRVVVHGTPGWEAWDGSAWVPQETAQAITWWGNITDPDYPGGEAQSGCDFQSKAGGWTPFANDSDFTFIFWQLCS